MSAIYSKMMALLSTLKDPTYNFLSKKECWLSLATFRQRLFKKCFLRFWNKSALSKWIRSKICFLLKATTEHPTTSMMMTTSLHLFRELLNKRLWN